MDKIIKEIILDAYDKKIFSEDDFLSLIKENLKGKNISSFPSNIILRKGYEAMVKKGEIERNKNIERLLITKKVRSLSGIAVITVLTKPYPCPGKCLYCPTEEDVPKSYLSTEPAVMRAILCKYDPYRQVEARLKSLDIEGHPTDKIELIVIGGTFSVLPREYQEKYIKSCFDALNTKKSKNLDEAKKKNEKAKHRCIGLTLETRPDYVDGKEIKWMRYLGATRVELGVQSVFDDILEKNYRGHGAEKTKEATRMLKDAGFKICYHMMPNLPGSTPQLDVEMFEIIFSDDNYQPDYVKIYPCVVVKGSELYKLWKGGRYVPYGDEELEKILIQIKRNVPYYIRIMRLIRDIPSQNIEAGSKLSNMRQILEEKYRGECKCIRCREVGENDEKTLGKSNLFVQEYNASGGEEIFLSYESKNRETLFALLRLRLSKNRAIVRELHTYGKQIEIGKKGNTQHKGWGRKLLTEAEKQAKDAGYNKILIISGVGARDYYRKRGYRLSGEYMVKNL